MAVLLGESEGVIFPGDMPAAFKDCCQLAGDHLSAAASRTEGSAIGVEDGELEDFTRRLRPSVEIPE